MDRGRYQGLRPISRGRASGHAQGAMNRSQPAQPSTPTHPHLSGPESMLSRGRGFGIGRGMLPRRSLAGFGGPYGSNYAHIYSSGNRGNLGTHGYQVGDSNASTQPISSDLTSQPSGTSRGGLHNPQHSETYPAHRTPISFGTETYRGFSSLPPEVTDSLRRSFMPSTPTFQRISQGPRPLATAAPRRGRLLPLSLAIRRSPAASRSARQSARPASLNYSAQDSAVAHVTHRRHLAGTSPKLAVADEQANGSSEPQSFDHGSEINSTPADTSNDARTSATGEKRPRSEEHLPEPSKKARSTNEGEAPDGTEEGTADAADQPAAVEETAASEEDDDEIGQSPDLGPPDEDDPLRLLWEALQE